MGVTQEAVCDAPTGQPDKPISNPMKSTSSSSTREKVHHPAIAKQVPQNMIGESSRHKKEGNSAKAKAKAITTTPCAAKSSPPKKLEEPKGPPTKMVKEESEQNRPHRGNDSPTQSQDDTARKKRSRSPSPQRLRGPGSAAMVSPSYTADPTTIRSDPAVVVEKQEQAAPSDQAAA